MGRKIEELTPEAQVKCREFLDRCAKAGIPVMLTSTLRTAQEQLALWLQGRADLTAVNRERAAAGLAPISQAENRKVTWTKNSRHLRGTAWDFAVMKDGKPTWDLKVNINRNDKNDYIEVGLIAESMGLRSGKSFPNPDYPHVELKEEL